MVRRPLGKRIGSRLRAQREARGWSQAELAEAAGISAHYAGVLERGEKTPTLETLVALAGALEVSSATLLGETATQDLWIDELAAAGAAVAKSDRPLVLALVKVISTHRR